MRTSRTQLLLAGGVIVLAAVGYGLYSRRLIEASAVALRRGPVVEAVYGLGTVVATRTYQVKVAVNEAVRKIFVREGATVRAGDPLISFDDPPVKRAPFDGTVTAVNFREDELVFPGTPILSLVDMRDLYLEVSLEQQAALRIRQKQRATISFESLRGQTFTGSVTSIYPREAQFIVRIDLPKFPEGILPAMTSDVAIEVGRKESALLIPVKAVSAGKTLVVRDGRRKRIEVRLGVIDGDWAEVVGGDLSPEDRVVLGNR